MACLQAVMPAFPPARRFLCAGVKMWTHPLWRCLPLLLLSSAVNTATTWQADHYWPMRDIYDGDVAYDWNGAWKGTVKGASVTWNPPQVGLRLNGQNDWIDLGTRHNACYVDVAYCPKGLTVALWVNIRGQERPQGLLTFGGKNCGVSLESNENAQLSVTIKSSKMKRVWELTSGRHRTLTANTWNHVAFTWTNKSDGISLYINGSRLDAVNTTFSNTTSNDCDSCLVPSPACEWTMSVGRQPAADAHVYSAIDLADLVLWSKVVTKETILEISKHVSGIYRSNSGCQSGWLSNLQFCYNIVKLNETWSDAHISCAQSHHAKLVSIGSQEEDEFLEAALTAEGISSCVHLGLKGNEESGVSWIDGNVWGFSRLESSSANSTGYNCVEREADGSWKLINCSQQCQYVCKRYREKLFRDAEFYCRVKRRDYRFTQHSVMIRSVSNELECALECLIYGSRCYSYNYRYITDSPGSRLHMCEINRSSYNSLSRPELLVAAEGFQYCARI